MSLAAQAVILPAAANIARRRPAPTPPTPVLFSPGSLRGFFAVHGKMFGGYCWMLNGNMLCGVEVGRFMFRVGKMFEAEALGRPGASPMDITDRPMKGSVWVRAEETNGTVLESWIDLAVRYVGSMPAK